MYDPASQPALCPAVACRKQAPVAPSGAADSALSQLLQMNPGDVMQRLDTLLQEFDGPPLTAGSPPANSDGAAAHSAGVPAQGPT